MNPFFVITAYILNYTTVEEVILLSPESYDRKKGESPFQKFNTYEEAEAYLPGIRMEEEEFLTIDKIWM